MDQAVATARANLERALERCAGLDMPSAGVRWGAYSAWLREHHADLTSVADVLRIAQAEYGFENRETGETLAGSIAFYQRKILAEFPDRAADLAAWQESPLALPETVVSWEGRPVSSMLMHLARFHLVASTYAGMPKTVCEIGGGYGAPARIWLRSRFNPCRRYTIVDLPESLFFAEVFLRHEFPDRRIRYSLDGEKGDAEIVLCPAPLIRRLHIDEELVVNTLSFPEMADAWVGEYMAALDRSSATHFYSFNAATRPLGSLAEHVNLYAPRPSRQWGARLLRFPYDGDPAEILFVRVDEQEAWLRHYRHVLAASERQLLDRRTFYAAVDALRYLADPQLTGAFLDRCLQEMPVPPKELLYLAERCGRSDLVERLSAARRLEEEGRTHASVSGYRQ